MPIPRIAVVVALALVAARAGAQEKTEYILTHKQTKSPEAAPPKCPDPAPKPAGPKGPWEFKFRVGSLFQFNSSKGVVGQRDGTSRSLGGDLHAEANWTRGRHEVKNRIDVNVVFIKTPNTPSWVSASNLLELENIYQYRVEPWAGPFTRLGFATSIFVGRDLRTNAVRYQLPDGSLIGPQTDIRLTDPLYPMTFLQTVGAFINPVRTKPFDLDFRGGVGAREVLADGQLGVQDDSMTTDIVELVELHDYSQAGLELIVMARGELLAEKRLQYYAGGEFLLPLIWTRQPGDDRNAVDLLDKRVRLGLAYKLASWATLLYELRIVHQPQLVDDVQIQNNFGFKAGYSVN